MQATQAAQLILRDRLLSEEVVQTAFVRIVERIQQFDDGRSFAPWFLRIIVNDSIKLAQKQQRYIPFDDEPDQEAVRLASWLVDPQPQPEELIEIKESRQVMRSALNFLNPEQRAVVVMRYFFNMSETEMSTEMERPPSTVKWWLRTARKRLKKLLRFREL